MTTQKVTITRVTVSDKTKDNRPLISSKSGKPYFKVGIQTNEYGATWINGLMPFNPDRWENSVQDLEIYDEEYQGKIYKKFKLPAREKTTAGLSDNDRALLTKAAEYAYAANTNVMMLKEALLQAGVLKPKKDDYPASPSAMPFADESDSSDINPEDIPFGE